MNEIPADSGLTDEQKARVDAVLRDLFSLLVAELDRELTTACEVDLATAQRHGEGAS